MLSMETKEQVYSGIADIAKHHYDIENLLETKTSVIKKKLIIIKGNSWLRY